MPAIKIGDTDEDESDQITMSVEMRTKLLAEMGITLHETVVKKFHANLNKIQAETTEKFKDVELSVEEQLNMKFSKVELKRLRQLGLTDERLVKLRPGENPFEDFKMGNVLSLDQLISQQKSFYS